MDSTTQVTLTILILLLTMIVSIVVTQFIRRRRDLYPLRDIPAYSALPMIIGQAIEANRPVHVSLGSVGLGGENTVLAVASAELFYQTANRAIISAAPTLLTVSDPSAIPIGFDTLRRAYQSRGMTERYRPGSVRWYPSGPRSLAFAAALTGLIRDDDVGANVLLGSFGTELALVAESAIRRDQPVIATSDQLEGQAIAYAMSDHALIGEEVFAAGAYLSDSPAQRAALVAQEVLRVVLIGAIFVPTALAVGDALSDGQVLRSLSALLAGLLGGG